MERVEDVLLHQKLLASAKDPDKRPVYHIRFLEVLLLLYFYLHSKRGTSFDFLPFCCIQDVAVRKSGKKKWRFLLFILTTSSYVVAVCGQVNVKRLKIRLLEIVVYNSSKVVETEIS